MITRSIASSFLLLVLLCGEAHAYVDPTTNNALLQILSGVFIVLSAGYVFLRNQLLRLFRALSRLFRRQAP